MSHFAKVISSPLRQQRPGTSIHRHGNPQEEVPDIHHQGEQQPHRSMFYHKITPFSTPEEIADRLLRDIETLADAMTDEDTILDNNNTVLFPNHQYHARMEKLYKELLFWIRDATSSRRDVADKVSHALKVLHTKLQYQLEGIRMDIVAEIKKSDHPPLVNRIIDTEQELQELKNLIASHPQLLEDVIETNVQRMKRKYPILGIPKLSIRLRDKIVVTQKAVPSQLMKRYNDCQERLRKEKEQLYDVEKAVEEAVVTHHDPNNYHREQEDANSTLKRSRRDPRLEIFARRYHYRVLALQTLRVLHNHRNTQQHQQQS